MEFKVGDRVRVRPIDHWSAGETGTVIRRILGNFYGYTVDVRLDDDSEPNPVSYREHELRILS